MVVATMIERSPMARSSASIALESRRGVAVGSSRGGRWRRAGVSGILAAGRAPAFRQTKELTFLTVRELCPETTRS